MWILPKSIISSFAPDTEESTSDLQEQSRRCALSLIARSKPLPVRIWSRKWKRDTWTRHLFGRILNHSHGLAFEEKYICYLADTLVNPSVRPASGEGVRTLDTCGPTLQMELPFFAHWFASLKTLKDTLRWDCPQSSVTWKSSVIKRRGEYSARLKSGRRTSGSGSSSWPTASARDWKDGRASSATMNRNSRPLNEVVISGHLDQDSHNSNGSRQELSNRSITEAEADGIQNQKVGNIRAWGTPRVTNNGGAPSPQCTGKGSRLEDQVAMWPTPCANDDNKSVEAHLAMKQRMGQRDGTNSNRTAITSLNVMVKLWPTASVPNGGRSPALPMTATGRKLDGTKGQGQAPMKQGTLNLQTQAKGKLNPRWVETLMGIPIGWCAPSCTSPQIPALMNSACSEMAASQPQWNEPFEPCGLSYFQPDLL